MDVKSRVITKIDNLFSEYNEEKNSEPVTLNMRKRHRAILGAISALKFLKGQIQNLDPAKFRVMYIKVPYERHTSIRQRRNPTRFRML